MNKENTRTRKINTKNMKDVFVGVGFRQPVMDFLNELSEKRKIRVPKLIEEIVETYMCNERAKQREIKESERYKLNGGSDDIEEETDSDEVDE